MFPTITLSAKSEPCPTTAITTAIDVFSIESMSGNTTTINATTITVVAWQCLYIHRVDLNDMGMGKKLFCWGVLKFEDLRFW